MVHSDQNIEDPMSELLGYQLRRASAVAMADLSGALAAVNLSPATASTLLIIEANPGKPQARIGETLGIQRANIAPIIARLEQEGLIERDDLSGRAIGLRCTARGKATAAAIQKIITEHERRVFNAIPRSEQKALIAALKLVQKRNQ